MHSSLTPSIFLGFSAMNILQSCNLFRHSGAKISYLTPTGHSSFSPSSGLSLPMPPTTEKNHRAAATAAAVSQFGHSIRPWP